MPLERAVCCELCLSDKFDLKKLSVLKKYGYQTVAITQTVGENVFESKKKNKKGETPSADCIPEPIKIPEDAPTDITILHRLNLEFSDASITHKLNQSENLKKYDILAVVPKTIAAFQYACCSMDADIISYCSENSTIFKVNRKLYRQAIDRGMHFELLYGPALKDSTYRKNFIQQAHIYQSVGKSANLLLSSGAENEFQIRGVYDIMNLGLILALSEKQTKNVLTENARKLLLKADNRRRGKVSVFVLQHINSKKRLLTLDHEDGQNKKRKTCLQI